MAQGTGLFLDRAFVIGVGSSLIALALLARRRSAGRLWAMGASLVVTFGFVQHHLLPTYSGGANPYWTFDEGFRGDFIRWITVLAIVACGVWTGWLAGTSNRAVPTGFEPVSPP